MGQLARDIAKRLDGLGLQMPPAPDPAATYLSFVEQGNLLFVSGQIPLENGKLNDVGNVPSHVSVEGANRAAQRAALNSLAQVQGIPGGLDRIARVVAVTIYVASDVTFNDQHLIANHASDLFINVLGSEIGAHSRTTIGCASLPLGAPVEVQAVYGLNSQIG